MSEKKDDNWEMPQPVFKSSEGSLPRSLEETISTSFMANAETIEIDEDDDILGIMDSSFIDKTTQVADADEEDILETGHEIQSASESQQDTSTDPTDDLKGVVSTPEVEQPKPIAVSAKGSNEKAEVKSNDPGSGFFIYILLALTAIVLAVLYYYFVQNK